jgi:hypothetical protein
VRHALSEALLPAWQYPLLVEHGTGAHENDPVLGGWWCVAEGCFPDVPVCSLCGTPVGVDGTVIGTRRYCGVHG